MEERRRRGGLLEVLLACFALLVVAAIGVAVFLFMTVSVTGTASLPNGAVATINGPFSCSDSGTTTTVTAGGRVFVFTATSVTVDGAPVRELDHNVKDVLIDATYKPPQLRIDGREIPIGP